MNTYALEKLVRDSSIKNMEDGGATVHSHQLNNADFKREALKKLGEEAAEALNTTTPEDLADELADMLEIIKTVAPLANTTMEELEKRRQTKAAKRGGFEKRLYVTTIECQPNSYWDDYCAKDPGKYPRK